MKKLFLLILFLLFFAGTTYSQVSLYWIDTTGGKATLRQVSNRYPMPVTLIGGLDSTRLAFLSKSNIFTGATNTFQNIIANKLIVDTTIANYIDSVLSTKWYNDTGGVIGYINSSTSEIAFFSKLTVGTNFVSTDTAFIQFAKIEHLLGGSPIDVQDSLIAIDTNVTIGNSTNYFGSIFGNNLYSKTLNVTGTSVMGNILLGTGNKIGTATQKPDSIFGVHGVVDTLFNNRIFSSNGTHALPSYSFSSAPSFGMTYYASWLFLIAAGVSLIDLNASLGVVFNRNIQPISSEYSNGTSSYVWKNTFTKSLTLGIDSIGASKSDTIKAGKNTMIVNCDASNNDTVFVANIGVSDGFEFSVIKVDAQATYVVVVPKGGYTIGDFATSDSFTGKTGRTYILKNKNFCIKP